MVVTEIDNLVPSADAAPAALKSIAPPAARRQHPGPIRPAAHLEAALRIATGAVTLSKSEAMKDAGAVLLGKLSNFRAIASGRRARSACRRPRRQARHVAAHRGATPADGSGNSRRIERTVAPGQRFPAGFWNNAAKHHWLSASVPTASGKSFLVLQRLIDHMRSGEARFRRLLRAHTRAGVGDRKHPPCPTRQGQRGSGFFVPVARQI